MTSLIFWGPYLAHKSIIGQRREKQRVKNYERWEGLRDDYDEQRKINRESRSLDIQRTGVWDPSTQTYGDNMAYDNHDRGIFTMRDQQEANDARTGWRPQEVWDGPRSQMQGQMTGQVPQYQTPRHMSATPSIPPHMTNSTSRPQLQPQKTGVTWDEGLPAPLQVSRRSFDEYDHLHGYRSGSTSSPINLSRQSSQSRRDSKTQAPNVSSTVPSRRQSPPAIEVVSVVEQPKNEFGFVDSVFVKPIYAPVAGGRMAELIERGY